MGVYLTVDYNRSEDYLAEYKDRINELTNQRRELYEIFEANANKPEIQIQAQREIHQTTRTMTEIYTKSLLPHLPLINSSEQEQQRPITEEEEELRRQAMEKNPDFVF